MIYKSRQLFLSCLLSVLLLGLAGCGGGDSNGTVQDFLNTPEGRNALANIGAGVDGPSGENVSPGTGSPIDFGGDGGTGGTSPISFLLFADPTPNGGGGSVISVAVAPDGTLSVVESEPSPGRPLGLDVSPNSQFVYTANALSETIFSFSISQITGELTQIFSPLTPINAAAPGNTCQRFVVHPSGDFGYALHANGDITSYLIAASGELSDNAASPPIFRESGSLKPTFNANGDRMYALNPGSDSITIFVVDLGTGALSYLNPGTPHFATPNSLGPADSVLSADGNFLYVAGEDNDSVSSYTIGVTGDLTFSQTVITDEGPRSLALHPTLAVLYSANGLGDTITAFTLGAAGEITPLGLAVAAPAAVEVVVDPSGNFLFTFRDDPEEVRSYSVNATGDLTLINSFDFFEFSFPQEMVIIPAL